MLIISISGFGSREVRGYVCMYLWNCYSLKCRLHFYLWIMWEVFSGYLSRKHLAHRWVTRASDAMSAQTGNDRAWPAAVAEADGGNEQSSHCGVTSENFHWTLYLGFPKQRKNSWTIENSLGSFNGYLVIFWHNSSLDGRVYSADLSQ